MDGDAGLAAIQARIAALRTVAAEAARAAAPAVERVVREMVSTGTDPDGRPWAPTKAGTRPLAHVADAITARVVGGVIQVALRGYAVYHHWGTRRDPQRRILPDGGAGIPPRIAEAIRTATIATIDHKTGGGG